MTLIGFVIGAIAALIFFAVATTILVFKASVLIFGLIALVIWAYFAFYWHPPSGVR